MTPDRTRPSGNREHLTSVFSGQPWSALTPARRPRWGRGVPAATLSAERAVRVTAFLLDQSPFSLPQQSRRGIPDRFIGIGQSLTEEVGP
jgi:hypothetical protein